MKIMSIDASTQSTGIAVFEQNKLILYKCLTTTGNTIQRILSMTQLIMQLYDQYQPDQIVMEDVLLQDAHNNQKTFKSLIYLQANIIIQFFIKNKNVQLVTASHWRSQVGIKLGPHIRRNQLKEASKKLVNQLYNIEVNDDISDAICIGIAYIKQHRSAF